MDTVDREAYRRLDQFVDAAFAFAVTLLLIAVAEPPANLADLKTALLRIPASAAAFALIVLFWSAHRDFGRLVPRRDTLTTFLSLAIVFTVLVYVFPLRLLTQSAFHFLSDGRLPGEGLINSMGDLQALYQIYGLGFALLSGLYAVLFMRAAQLADSAERREDAVRWRDPWTICAISGVLSALIALAPLDEAPWLPPTVYWLIPFAIWGRVAWRARASKAARPSAAAEAA